MGRRLWAFIESEVEMGRGDNRRTPKARQRAGQRRKKARLKAKAEQKKSTRKSSK